MDTREAVSLASSASLVEIVSTFEDAAARSDELVLRSVRC
jgi:hypothetical protein